eukprot:maker-scaffold_5-snap-gene-16.5-mRNA-1 protein AED:0.28 eAED:0.28 QI:127/1/1/1/1/1/2/134/492
MGECDYSFLWPSGDNCSEGACLPNYSTCDCEGDFISVEDFILEPLDCDIDKAHMAAFWGWVLIFSAIAAITPLLFLIILLRNHFKKNAESKHLGKNDQGMKLESIFIGFSVLCLTTQILSVALGALKRGKIGNQDRIIGYDIGISLLFSFTAIGYQAIAFLFPVIASQILFSHVALFITPTSSFQSSNISNLLFPIAPLSFLITLGFPLALCLLEQPELSTIMTPIFLFLIMTLWGTFSLRNLVEFYRVSQTFLSIFLADDEFDVHNRLHREFKVAMNYSKSRLSILQKANLLFGPFLILLLSLFSVWPFLTRKTPYLITLFILIGSLLIITTCVALFLESKKNLSFKAVADVSPAERAINMSVTEFNKTLLRQKKSPQSTLQRVKKQLMTMKRKNKNKNGNSPSTDAMSLTEEALSPKEDADDRRSSVNMFKRWSYRVSQKFNSFDMEVLEPYRETHDPADATTETPEVSTISNPRSTRPLPDIPPKDMSV